MNVVGTVGEAFEHEGTTSFRGDEYGPADIEVLTDRYFDRATISRMTVPEMEGKPPRKSTRRRSGS